MRLRNSKSQKWGMISRKFFQTKYNWFTYKIKETLKAYIKPTQVQNRQNSRMERGNGHKFPILT